MRNSRDDFSSKTKDLLANRVGRRCSNPNCRRPTCAAATNPDKFTNIGVASHICAAANGGPRYDENMTPEDRKSFENGIWLCQSCSKLIDTDTTFYTKDLLLAWKEIAELYACTEVQTISPVKSFEEDKELIKFFSQCFDRSAFKDVIYEECSMEDFDKAIEDTIIAINTGILRKRDGTTLRQSEGKYAIKNSSWREKLDTIDFMLNSIRRHLKIAKKEKAYKKHDSGNGIFYIFLDKDLGLWFDSTRNEILKLFSSICKQAGLPELNFPYRRYKYMHKF